MIFNDYQSKVRKYADYPHELGPFYIIMDMMKNVGTISDNLKKSILKDGNLNESMIMIIKRNLGYLLNNISNIAADLDLNLEDIAQDNIYYLEVMNKNKEN